MSHRPHICFVAPAIWPVFSASKNPSAVGGAELQQTLLARAFRLKGYRVSLVTMDYGQGDNLEVDGINVYSTYKPESGIRFLRFLHPHLTSVWTAMKRANADYYYQRSSDYLTGVIARFCKQYGRRFIYAGAHDADFDPALPLVHHDFERRLYRYGLSNAHAIVAQSEAQIRACRTNFGRDATLVRSCYVLPEGARADPNGYVLWVATMRDWKRPQFFIELARLLPQFHFRMVGGPESGVQGAQLYAQLRSEARQLPNLEWAGAVPYSGIDAHFNGARVFVNTSQAEGFPNTFLQAWARDIPTVSFVDTGSLFEGTPVVCKVDDLKGMAETVKRLMEDRDHWSSRGALSRSCFLEQHLPVSALRGYESILDGWRHSD